MKPVPFYPQRSVPLPLNLILDPSLSSGALRTWALACHYATDNRGVCPAIAEDLARELRMDLSTAHNHLSELERAGWVQLQRVPTGKRGRPRHLVRLLAPVEARKAA